MSSVAHGGLHALGLGRLDMCEGIVLACLHGYFTIRSDAVHYFAAQAAAAPATAVVAIYAAAATAEAAAAHQSVRARTASMIQYNMR